MKHIHPDILIADSESDLVESLKSKLQDEGYHVTTCSSMESCCELLKNKNFCCIVVDQKLRDGYGEQIVNQVRQDKTHVNFETPIVFMSAHMGPEFIKKIGKAVDSVLFKPFGRTEFAEVVKELCPV